LTAEFGLTAKEKTMEIALLPIKPGTMSAKDKATLREAGVVVVEHEKPETLRLLTPTAEIGTMDMLRAAMFALVDSGNASTSARADFTTMVARMVKERHTAKQAKA
jgi:ATP phosphoribosyltransferase regulatory subunit HisZ